MKFLLIYISPNNTTKKTTELLGDIIRKNGNSVDIIDLGKEEHRNNQDSIIKMLNSYDVVGFGAPIYHMDILKPIKDLMIKISERLICYRFKAFIYLNYAGITSGKAFQNGSEILKRANISILGGLKLYAPHFHHDEKFPTDKTLEIVEEFYRKIEAKKFKTIEWLKVKKVFKPHKWIINLIYPFVHNISKKRELPITINISQCKGCKKCLKECPVGAIDEKINIDTDKCLHCYHCVITCPLKVISSPIEKIDKMISMNKKIIGTENPRDKIFI